jgi:hypothetical protein
MSALTPPTPTAANTVADDPSAARVVLFGMPDAGKSSLLGALAQAAHTQPRILRGHLTDLTHGLADLRRKVYDDRPTETQQEIVPYPVRFSPAGDHAHPAVLYDCDGRVANDILTQKKVLGPQAKAGSLAATVLSADALILAVDASATLEQMDGDFREFLRFLRLLEKYRTREHEVGGFPVYLVLTKCDVLGTPQMTKAQWEARIAERRKEVERRFKDFLQAEGVGPDFLSFGSVDLDVFATAVKRPDLADATAHPREPLGVAELFHAALDNAIRFRDRRKRSSRRLAYTVAGAGTFLGALLIAGLAFFTAPPPPEQSSLQARVEALQANEGSTAAVRLGPGLERRLRELTDVQKHPDFEKLPDALKTYVRQRLEEGQAYQRFRDDLAAIPLPTAARSLGELRKIEERVSKIAPPGAYIGEWATTEAGQRRDTILSKDIPAIRKAVEQLTQRYFSLKNSAAGLLATTDLSPAWAEKVRALTEDAEKNPPFPRTDPLLGPAFAYDDVALAETEWQAALKRVTLVRDLSTALGLIGDPTAAPLALTEPAPGTTIAELYAKRWQSLKTYYPDFARWSVADLPDGVREDVRRRLRRSIDQMVRDGQRLAAEYVKAINPTDKEITADWPRVADFLLSQPLQEWRDLSAFLVKLDDPKAEAPGESTAAFLRRPTFELDFKRARIRIPDALSDAPVKPAGDLKLYYRKAEGGDWTTISLKPDGEQRDKQTVVYVFAGDGKATYRPGDTFYGELAVRRGDRDMRLTWYGGRTRSFQFECLVMPPRMHAPDQTYSDGPVADGVSLAVIDGTLPMVPPLIPNVRR